MHLSSRCPTWKCYSLLFLYEYFPKNCVNPRNHWLKMMKSAFKNNKICVNLRNLRIKLSKSAKSAYIFMQNEPNLTPIFDPENKKQTQIKPNFLLIWVRLYYSIVFSFKFLKMLFENKWKKFSYLNTEVSL